MERRPDESTRRLAAAGPWIPLDDFEPDPWSGPWHVEARLRGPAAALTAQADPPSGLALGGPMWWRRSGSLAVGGTVEWIPLLARPVAVHQLRPNLARLDPESSSWELSPAVQRLIGPAPMAELPASALAGLLKQAEELAAASSQDLSEALALALPHEMPRLQQLLEGAGIERRWAAAAWGLFAHPRR